jgi:hypothetical protein
MCEPVIFCFYRLGEKELDDLLAGIQLRCSSGPEGVLPKGQILKQILYYIEDLRFTDLEGPFSSLNAPQRGRWGLK